jgi:hypothetical protein
MSDIARRRADRYTEPIRETRTGQRVEIRQTESGDHEFAGYASTFNQWYEVEDFLGVYQERIMSGAFTLTLERQDDVALLVNHEGLPLARTSSGTLDLAEDPIGLRSEATLLAKDPDVQRVVPKMERGDLSQMSFAFQVAKGGQEWNEDYTERTITEVKLFDVSIVTFPANPFTSAAVRGVDVIELLGALDPEDPELLVAVRDGIGADLNIDRGLAVLNAIKDALRGDLRDIDPTIRPKQLAREIEMFGLRLAS